MGCGSSSEAPPVREAPPEVPSPSTAAAASPAPAAADPAPAPAKPKSALKPSKYGTPAPVAAEPEPTPETTMSRDVDEHDPDKHRSNSIVNLYTKETSWEEKLAAANELVAAAAADAPPPEPDSDDETPGLSMAAAAEAAVAGGGLATLGADSSLAARADPNAPAKMSISVDASGKARVEGAASPELR